MKKTLAILLFVPFFSGAQAYNKEIQAQNYLHRLQFYGYENSFGDYYGIGDALRKGEYRELGIQKVTIERGHKNNKLEKTEYQLTDAGRISSIKNPKEDVQYSYVQDSLVGSIVRNGKEEYTTNFEYSNSGKLRKKEVYKGDRLQSRVVLDYGEEDKVLFCLLQSGRKLRKSYAMSYQYEDKQLSKQKFMCNDEVVRTWDYSCDPKGEVVDEKKHSTLCTVREENNDGSYTEFVRKVKDGEVFLYTHHYDKNHKNYASSCEKESGIKIWESTNSENERTSISYSDKGTIEFSSVTKYDSEGRTTESIYTYGKKQKKTSRTVYSYHENGLIKEQKSFYKGKPSYVRKYAYES